MKMYEAPKATVFQIQPQLVLMTSVTPQGGNIYPMEDDEGDGAFVI